MNFRKICLEKKKKELKKNFTKYRINWTWKIKTNTRDKKLVANQTCWKSEDLWTCKREALKKSNYMTLMTSLLIYSFTLLLVELSVVFITLCLKWKTKKCGPFTRGSKGRLFLLIKSVTFSLWSLVKTLNNHIASRVIQNFEKQVLKE